jgi:hypothetical protein
MEVSMKKNLFTVICVLLGLVLAGGSMAGQLGQLKDKMKEKTKEVAEGMTFTGEVVSIEEEAQTFKVKGEETKEMEFHAKEAKVMLDGEQKALTDLVKGSHVTVTFTTKGEKHTAIQVKTKKES